jgi:RimJ/RimL family protein N-acetyltransferase
MEEFELLPMKLGWKYEYWDGQARISPRGQAVAATVKTRPTPTRFPHTIRPVTESDEPQLVAAYIEAFADSFDFCDWELSKITEAAKEDIRKILSGQRGRLLAASRVATASPSETAAETIIGASLITGSDRQPPLLDILFVVPQRHRKGIATALVSAGSHDLYRAGVETLESRYLLGNEESRAWHQQFGFTEEADLMLARAYYHHAKHELWRREKIGGLLDEERERLVAERDRRHARVEELEALAKELGMEAVLPILRR